MSSYGRFGWLRIRHSKRGWRAGFGPRIYRRWAGAGGRGVSTGIGPFTKYFPKREVTRCPVCHRRIANAYTDHLPGCPNRGRKHKWRRVP